MLEKSHDYKGRCIVETKVYSLIIGAKSSKYHSAGWLAGSIPAHLISCQLNGKVFWFCPAQFVRGTKKIDREKFREMIDKILSGELSIGTSYKGLKLNNYGYFLDFALSAVAWRFKLLRIFPGYYFKQNKQEEKKYHKYFSFREVYKHYTKKESENSYWFLISDIEKIIQPISLIGENGKYHLKGFKYGDKALFTHHFRWGGIVFSPKIPEGCNITKKVKATDEIDTYLKQFFLTELKDKNLLERAIQQAFAITLMDEYKNWTPVMEEKLSNEKRPDIIFREGKRNIVVVEIKRGDENPVDQLDDYIKESKKRYRNKNLKGLIICGDITNDIKKDAGKKRYPIDMIQYEVPIKFEKKISNKKK
jgi:hypothetical protein